MREVVAGRELLDLLTAGRRPAEDAAASLLRRRLSSYRFGIAVRRVEFQDIHPPLAVLDAYRDVSRAVSDRQRRVNEATAYRDSVVTEAGGQLAGDPAGRRGRSQPHARPGRRVGRHLRLAPRRAVRCARR